MMVSVSNVPAIGPQRLVQDTIKDCRNVSVASGPHHRWLSLAGVVGVLLTVGTAIPASAQTTAALGEPPAQTQPAKPMTPERVAWMKGRCAQLVAFFDYYGVSRGENSDGARNHTRIGATIECSRTNYRWGIGTMAVLLKHKAFDLPKPGTPVLEPEDDGAPDITNPTQQRY